MSHDLDNVVCFQTEPGQDSERASLGQIAQQMHVLAWRGATSPSLELWGS
jgi:hypothetical protein